MRSCSNAKRTRTGESFKQAYLWTHECSKNARICWEGAFTCGRWCTIDVSATDNTSQTDGELILMTSSCITDNAAASGIWLVTCCLLVFSTSGFFQFGLTTLPYSNWIAGSQNIGIAAGISLLSCLQTEVQRSPSWIFHFQCHLTSLSLAPRIAISKARPGMRRRNLLYVAEPRTICGKLNRMIFLYSCICDRRIQLSQNYPCLLNCVCYMWDILRANG